MPRTPLFALFTLALVLSACGSEPDRSDAFEDVPTAIIDDAPPEPELTVPDCLEPECDDTDAEGALGALGTASGGLDIATDAATFRIHRHDPVTGAQVALTETRTWSSGWSFVKTFVAGGKNFVFLLKTQDGRAHVRALNANGTLGAAIGTYQLTRDVTAAEFLYPQGAPVLLLAQRQTGRVVLRRMLDDGRVGTVLQSTVSPYAQHRDVVTPYRVGSAWFLFTLDRWHGRASILALGAQGTLGSGAAIYDAWWTRGWSHAAFYNEGDATFALLYKTAAVPGLGQGGKFGVKQVLPSGVLADGWVQGPLDWSEGHTQLHVMAVPGPVPPGSGSLSELSSSATVPHHVLWTYKTHSGAAKALALGTNGVGDLLWSGALDTGWTGISGYVAQGVPYLVEVNEEGEIPFDHTMVAELRAAIDAAYEGKVMGYQLGVMQSGRIVDLHAAGLSNRELDIPMTTLIRQDLASVSKMVTAVTILKMAEQGWLDLDDRMIDHLYVPRSTPHAELYYLPADQTLDPSLQDVRIIELLTYTARFASSSSASALWSGPRVAAACDAALLGDASWSNPTAMRCNDGYQNSAFGMLGFIALEQAGIPSVAYENTVPYQEFIWDLWMRDALLDGMHCQTPDDDVAGAYAVCTPGSAGCVDGFKTLPNESAGYCLSGSWRANAEDLLVLLSAMRYGKVLGKEMTQLLLSQELQAYSPGAQAPGAPGSAVIGWNSGATSIPGMSEKGLGKAGGAGGVATYVYHLPRHVDVALVMNTSGCGDAADPCPSLGATIVSAFGAAVQ